MVHFLKVPVIPRAFQLYRSIPVLELARSKAVGKQDVARSVGFTSQSWPFTWQNLEKHKTIDSLLQKIKKKPNKDQNT